MTIQQLRADIKPLGYTVKTRAMSYGHHATYKHTDTSLELTGNVFTPESLAIWNPLFDYLRINDSDIKALGKSMCLYGLCK